MVQITHTFWTTKAPVERKRFTDMTFLCGEEKKPIGAHRCVLVAQSKVFNALFETNCIESQKCEIELPDFDLHIVEHFLILLYEGRICATEEEIYEIYQICHLYAMDDIIRFLNGLLVSRLSSSNALKVLSFGRLHSEALTTAVLDFIHANANEFFKNIAVMEQNPPTFEELVGLLEDNALPCAELLLLNFAKGWAKNLAKHPSAIVESLVDDSNGQDLSFIKRANSTNGSPTEDVDADVESRFKKLMEKVLPLIRLAQLPLEVLQGKEYEMFPKMLEAIRLWGMAPCNLPHCHRPRLVLPNEPLNAIVAGVSLPLSRTYRFSVSVASLRLSATPMNVDEALANGMHPNRLIFVDVNVPPYYFQIYLTKDAASGAFDLRIFAAPNTMTPLVLQLNASLLTREGANRHCRDFKFLMLHRKGFGFGNFFDLNKLEDPTVANELLFGPTSDLLMFETTIKVCPETIFRCLDDRCPHKQIFSLHISAASGVPNDMHVFANGVEWYLKICTTSDFFKSISLWPTPPWASSITDKHRLTLSISPKNGSTDRKMSVCLEISPQNMRKTTNFPHAFADCIRNDGSIVLILTFVQVSE